MSRPKKSQLTLILPIFIALLIPLTIYALNQRWGLQKEAAAEVGGDGPGSMRFIDIAAATYTPSSGYLTVHVRNGGGETRYFSPKVYNSQDGWITLDPAQQISPGNDATWTSEFQAEWEATVISAELDISEPYSNPQTECATVGFQSYIGGGSLHDEVVGSECTYFDMDRFWSEPENKGDWRSTTFYGHNHNYEGSSSYTDPDTGCIVNGEHAEGDVFFFRYNGGYICRNCPEACDGNCDAAGMEMIGYYRGNPTAKIYGIDPAFTADILLMNNHHKSTVPASGFAGPDDIPQRQHNLVLPYGGCQTPDPDCCVPELQVAVDGAEYYRHRQVDCGANCDEHICINYQGLKTVGHGMLMSIETMPVTLPFQEGPKQYAGGDAGTFCCTTGNNACDEHYWSWKYGGDYLGYYYYEVPEKNYHFIAKTYRMHYFEEPGGFKGEKGVNEYWYLAEGYGVVRVKTVAQKENGDVCGYDIDMTAYDFENGHYPCRLPGDLDCDCKVNIVDIMMVAAIWNTKYEEVRFNLDYDFDDDRRISIADIMYVAAKWGTRCGE